MKIALLIHGSTVARWQADAIEQLGGRFEIVIYNCTNAPSDQRKLRHAPYYLLNLVSLRSEWTRRNPLPSSLASARRVNFECETAGTWQKLPQGLIDHIAQDRPMLIIKLGMGLLRVPEPDQCAIPILSFHHGDPREFRGRPAGFYELLNGRRVIGQIVQILSNRLDAGRVLAFAETKAHSHSYRATMKDAYAVSPLLLPQAIRAALDYRTLPIPPTGKAYRLPLPLTVLHFALQRSLAKIRRLAYGALVEKIWQVAEAPRSSSTDVMPSPFPPPKSWKSVARPRGYRFLADPFYHPGGGGILVEALKSSSGLGEILHIFGGGIHRLLSGTGHFSYPATISIGGRNFLIPEVCEWSEPRLYDLAGDVAREIGKLQLPRPSRLVDPTLFEWKGNTYLFANIASEPSAILRLWVADSVSEPFSEHRTSPILISPKGARMGGAIIQQDGAIYRVGQDGRNEYGEGVILFRIEELSPSDYQERAISTLRFQGYCGPHTLNMTSDRLLFDFYRNRVALLAGVRRIRARLAGRV